MRSRNAKAREYAKRAEELDLNSDGDVQGYFHIACHEGYSNPRPAFKAVDNLLLEKLEDVTRKFGCSGQETPRTALKKAISKNVLWEEIEQTFMQSDFWERDGDPLNRADNFTGNKGLSSVDKVLAFLTPASKQEVWEKQMTMSNRLVPEAKKWFDNFVADADIAHSISLDMKKVWTAVALHDIQLESASGSGRDEFGMKEASFLEIGIIRLPDVDMPRVKVFRLRLTVWNQCKPTPTRTSSIFSGIRGVLTSCKFRPRANYQELISEVVKDMRAAEGKSTCRYSFKGVTDAVSLNVN